MTGSVTSVVEDQGIVALRKKNRRIQPVRVWAAVARTVRQNAAHIERAIGALVETYAQ